MRLASTPVGRALLGVLVATGLALTTGACDSGYNTGPTHVSQPETLITANDTGGLDIVPGDNTPERVGAFPREAGVAEARAGEAREQNDVPEPTTDKGGEPPHSHTSYLVVRIAQSGEETVFGLGYGTLWVYSTGAAPQAVSEHIVLAELTPGQRVIVKDAPARTSTERDTTVGVTIEPADATPAAYVGRWTVTLTPADGGDPRKLSFGVDPVQAGQVAGEATEAVKGGSCVTALTLVPWDGDPLHRERAVLRAENTSGPDGRCGRTYWIQLQVDGGKTVVKVSELENDFSPEAVTASGAATKSS